MTGKACSLFPELALNCPVLAEAAGTIIPAAVRAALSALPQLGEREPELDRSPVPLREGMVEFEAGGVRREEA